MAIAPEDRTTLLNLARGAVEAAVRHKAPPRPPALTGVLGERRGCFVTLTNHGRLRGCIGTFQPREPLGLTVIRMGEAAARDPRFVGDRITVPELPQLTVEVSVLSPLEETDHPEKLQIGTHGIYIVRGPYAGCFLPEVATDQGWNAVEFLDQCCMGKAGLPRGSWRQADTKVYLFTSEKFTE